MNIRLNDSLLMYTFSAAVKLIAPNYSAFMEYSASACFAQIGDENRNF